MKGKTCFIATPIGKKGSEIRINAESVIKNILEPILEEAGYTTTVPQEILEPGLIVHDVIGHLLEDDLVIANLTGLNHNVVYELAVRHATYKPIITICEENTILPFDFAGMRTFFYTNDASGREKLKSTIRAALSSIDDPQIYMNPILSVAGVSQLLLSKTQRNESELFQSFMNFHGNEFRISLPWLRIGENDYFTCNEALAASEWVKHLAKLNIRFNISPGSFHGYGNFSSDDGICIGGPLANEETHLYFATHFPLFKCMVRQEHYEMNKNAIERSLFPYLDQIMEPSEESGFLYGGKNMLACNCKSDYAIIVKLTDEDFVRHGYSEASTVHMIFSYGSEGCYAATKYFCARYKDLLKRFANKHYFIALKVIPAARGVDLSADLMDLTEVMFGA